MTRMGHQDAMFEQHRAYLLNVAYRMLGEIAAAEDVVQEAWLRWRKVDAADILDSRAWLTATAIRLSLDALRKVRARRESYVGPWLPEPLVPDDMRAFAADRVAEQAELASDLSLALLHVLERLSPEERAALILRDAFDCGYEVIAQALGKNEAACRKLISRARERVRLDRPRFATSEEARRDLLSRFAKASLSIDETEMARLFAPDAIAYSDSGGSVKAALNPIVGGERIARFILGVMRKFYLTRELQMLFADINGRPGLVLFSDDTVFAALTIEGSDGRITALYSIQNPEKVRRLTQALDRDLLRVNIQPRPDTSDSASRH